MKIKEDLVVERLGSKFVIVSVDKKVFDGMIEINQTGKFLLELMEKETTIGKLSESLSNKYGIDITKAESDVREFIKPFIQLNLITGAVDE